MIPGNPLYLEPRKGGKPGGVRVPVTKNLPVPACRAGNRISIVPGNPNHEIIVIRTETGTHSRPNLLTTISCELAAVLPS